MRLKITAAQLTALDACSEGVAAFCAAFGDAAEIEWTAAAQIKLLRGPLGRWIGWAHHQGLLPLWAMNRASLVGASLVGARLDGARLDGARLVGASLDRARLVGASLDGASLERASLDGASLDGASLVGARLDGASLVGASLDGASLFGASLDGASLDGASLDEARICLCRNAACVRLRELLAAAGWAPAADGLLSRATTPPHDPGARRVR